MRRIRPFLAALAVFTTAAAAAPIAATGEVRRVRALMGTVLEIRAWGADAPVSRAITAAFDEVARLESVLSLYRPETELSRMNAAPENSSTEVGPDILGLAVRSAAYNKGTNGAFDPSIEPLARFWRAGGGWTAAEWRRSARDVGLRHFTIDAGRRRIAKSRRGAGLNFDGIAKGTALDAAAETLRTGGIASARMNFGGQILSMGPLPDESIVISNPATGEPLARFVFGGGSVATASQHERRVSGGGKTWGHIIDPRSRRVVETEGSVTVLAPTAEEADALDTALLVLGASKGLRLLSSHYPNASALFVERTGNGWRLIASPGFPSGSLETLDASARIAGP